MPLPWLIIGGIIALCAIGAITISVIKEEMRKKNINGCIVEAINRCNNTVKFADLYSNKSFEIEGDSISDDLYEGECIYV